MKNKEFAHKMHRLTHFPRNERGMFAQFFYKSLAKARLVVENAASDMADVACHAVDLMVRFVSDAVGVAVDSIKAIGLVSVLAFLILALIMSGCATGYYAHVWCKSSTKNVSFGLYTQNDGKLMVKVYDADGGCSYVKDQNVVIQDENQTVK